MNDSEDKLRSALTARAESVRVGEPRPGVTHRIGVRRRQRHRRIALGSGALAVIVAVGVLVPIVNRDDHHGGTGANKRATLAATGELRSQLVRDTRPAVPASAVKRLVDANTATALDLYGQLAKTPGNVFFSPYSITTALTMAAAGARGHTLQQMLAVLHDQLPAGEIHAATNALNLALLGPRARPPAGADGKPLELELANAEWSQTGFAVERAFLDVLARDYGAPLNTLNFERDPKGATDAINRWVAQHTNNKIKNLFDPPLDPATRVVLANAVHFKASWQQPFDPNQTSDGEFTTTSGSTVTVPFLHGQPRITYAAAPGWQAADIPYIGDASMTVVVPDAGTFADFEHSLDPAKLASIVGDLQPSDLTLALPKLDLKDTANLIPALRKLGMTDAFAANADFSGISRTASLSISKVVHQATVTVDEKGTEAAAATGIAFEESLVNAHSLVVDRPYLFFIRDTKTGSILFMGRVTDPTQQSAQQG